MIEVLRQFPDNVLAFVCHGQVTQHDYATAVIPAVTKAFEGHENVRLYYETAADFTGIDPAAVWEDTKVSIAHWRQWERIAVVTDVEWIKQTVNFSRLLISGKLRIFPNAEATLARKWIVAG